MSAVVAYSISFHNLPTNENPAAWGAFGDFLGGLLNPLISGLTLFVAVQVWQLQRVELSETKKVLTEQAKTASQQRGEQRFFDLMHIYQQTLNSFQADRDSQQMIGKSVLDYYVFGNGWRYTHLAPEKLANQKVWSEKKPLSSDDNESALDIWKNTVKADWLKKSTQFEHYFRVLHRILCDANFLLEDDRFQFIRMFRAQLNNSELILLGLNLWASPEGKKMHTIASEYGLLKHLPVGDFRDLLEQELPAEVFGRKFAAAKMT